MPVPLIALRPTCEVKGRIGTDSETSEFQVIMYPRGRGGVIIVTDRGRQASWLVRYISKQRKKKTTHGQVAEEGQRVFFCFVFLFSRSEAEAWRERQMSKHMHAHLDLVRAARAAAVSPRCKWRRPRELAPAALMLANRGFLGQRCPPTLLCSQPRPLGSFVNKLAGIFRRLRASLAAWTTTAVEIAPLLPLCLSIGSFSSLSPLALRCVAVQSRAPFSVAVKTICVSHTLSPDSLGNAQ